MVIDNEMVAAAKIVPELKPETVRRMLEAALSGQLFVAEGEGQKIIDGKSHYPDYITV
jgi:hypothetical protein